MLVRTALSIVLFLISYASFFIVNVPVGWVAARVDARLRPFDAAVLAARGSAWHGRGELAVAGAPLGTLAWSASPWTLLHGGLAVDLRLRGAEIVASARLQSGKELHVSRLDGRAALPLLARLADLPTALDGTLVAHVAEATLGADGTLESATGTLEAHDARLPRLGVSLGTLTLRLAPNRNGVRGVLGNHGGDLAVAGELSLTAAGGYALHAALKPAAGKDRIRDALAAVLGPPDADGRYHYAVAGRLRP